jgi:hypothetical protein
MDSENKKPSPSRKWWLLIGGIVVFVVAFDLLERFVPSEAGSAASEDAVVASGPAPPVVRRLDDGAIEIRHDFFRHSTIRLEDENDEIALFDCLAEGIERTFGEGTAGWTRTRVRSETQRIQDECLGSNRDLPVPPPRRDH